MQFWAVGQAVKTMPVTNIYDWNQQVMIRQELGRRAATPSSSALLANALKARPTLELVGTPFLYSVFSMISTGNFASDYVQYCVLSQLLFIGALLYLCLILKFSVWETGAFIFGSTIFFWSFLHEIWLSNITFIEVGGIGGVIFLGRQKNCLLKHSLIGFGLALGFFLKPTFSYVVIFMLIRHILQNEKFHIWLEGGGFFLGTVFAFVVPWLIFGSACTWPQWYRCAPNFLLDKYYQQFSFLYSALGYYSRTSMLVWNMILVSLPVGMLIKRRHDDVSDDFFPIGVGICC